MTELIETAPKMDLAIEDIAHLVEELRAYHAIYSPLFQRREQRDAAHVYLQGLLAALPAYWFFWRRTQDFPQTRMWLTGLLVFSVWFSFVVGHILNNVRGLG